LRLSEALSVAGVPSASGDKLLTATHGAKIARIANAFQLNWCAALLRETHGKRGSDCRRTSALLTPKFSCWVIGQSDFGRSGRARIAQSLRTSPKAGLWRGSQRCGLA
jgi:hypothetical protein